MRLEIRILDDNDQVVAEFKGDPCQPGQWRAQPGKTIIGNMPSQSDQPNTGTYELFMFTYQPNVKISRPNGYTAPVPSSPNNGQNIFAGLPKYFQSQSKPSPLASYPAPNVEDGHGMQSNVSGNFPKPLSSWSTSAPTASPAPSAPTQTRG